MLFNSLTFTVFFIIVCCFYWILRRSYKKQNVLLFIASYIFYGWWDVRFLFLIVLSTFVDYRTSLFIDRGYLNIRQQLKSSLYLLLSAFLFVTCRWHQVDWHRLDFSLLMPVHLHAWWVMFVAIFVIAGFHVMEAIAVRLDRTVSARVALIGSVSINLCILGVFKYFNFFMDNFVLGWEILFGSQPGWLIPRIILPVGISFFTFQTMSHAIDVYRKKIPATDSLLDLGTYVAFFPQLVAGPIEPGYHLLPQFERARSVYREQVHEGMWLIFWGLYKKVVVADNVARIVNDVFGPYDSLSSISVPEDGVRCLIAVYAFAIQIYCDFSGYTDMARGVARLLGFEIMLNFNLPYLATNPSEFWSRWHISLSSWLRDYLYIPLGGNRGGRLRTYRNLLITMILGGLWHGAAWTFILWGLFHGLILVCFRWIGINESKPKLTYRSVIQAVIMFHLVCIGWLLFRAQNLTTVSIFLQSIVGHFQGSETAWSLARSLLFYSWFLLIFQAFQAWTGDLDPLKRIHWFGRLHIWVFLIISIYRLMPIGKQEFIYFAF
jgi:D-alanyl-lipoteichoic acid acyltransferase DltB (MBOAT superfamily)